MERPFVRMENFFNMDALLDTGSILPVWTASEEKLKAVGGKLIARDKPFGGFGGMTTGNIYEIQYFCIGELTFPHFHIIASPSDLPCQMLLSATMFHRLIYEIDDYNYALNITVPDTESFVRDLRIKDVNGRLQVFCTNVEE